MLFFSGDVSPGVREACVAEPLRRFIWQGDKRKRRRPGRRRGAAVSFLPSGLREEERDPSALSTPLQGGGGSGVTPSGPGRRRGPSVSGWRHPQGGGGGRRRNDWPREEERAFRIKLDLPVRISSAALQHATACRIFPPMIGGDLREEERGHRLLGADPSGRRRRDPGSFGPASRRLAAWGRYVLVWRRSQGGGERAPPKFRAPGRRRGAQEENYLPYAAS